MDTFLKAIGAIVLAAALVAVLPVLTVLGGAFSGWIVGMFWPDLLVDFFKPFGIDMHGLQLWQAGAALGFLGSFFRTAVNNTKKS